MDPMPAVDLSFNLEIGQVKKQIKALEICLSKRNLSKKDKENFEATLELKKSKLVEIEGR